MTAPAPAAHPWLSALGYPGALAVVLGGGTAAVSAGIDAEAVLTIGSVISLLLVVGLEWAIPYRSQWASDQGDVRADLCHAVVSNLVLPAVYRVVAVALIVPFARGSWWPHDLPLVAQLALAALVAETSQYWAHRLGHAGLWRLHAVHHSPARLYWLNAGRDHPLGLLLLFWSELIPLLLLGAPAEVIALQTLFTVIVGMLQHTNADLRAGWLNYAFATPELHRWHHVRDPAVGNCNFGSNLIVWDLVFGTWHLPAEPAPDDLGIDLSAFPTDYLGQLAVPFRWRSLSAGHRMNPADQRP